ncbi:zf-HC2 domain-containing protein [Desulfosporosinus sp. OT]|uniref:anti-sigma factor family protein n=1 Tax=Desulfosporosinus sp. OT TaxID=913865 RepID=UPI001300C561|nr:zf-HC2 domain-containing protein [Desulfosporosinus sp. OT]
MVKLECHESLERISEYIDGELCDTEYGEIKVHLLSCQNCQNVAREFQMLHEKVQQSLENTPVPIDLEQRILIAIEREQQKVSKQRVITLIALVMLGIPLLLLSPFLLRIVHLFYSTGYAFWRIKTVLMMLLPTTTSWGIGVTSFFLTVIGIYMIRALLRGSRFKEVSL